ncbi:ATP-binding SpoIIE family protein phosphatase [Streptomyces cyaneofuscatus]|uniref:ATP-binding SpoIIE family protein phosphatase n=1 Tax=Streptomyces cyaneofuscatus TaxID=66883 RepID=UPI0033F43997
MGADLTTRAAPSAVPGPSARSWGRAVPATGGTVAALLCPAPGDLLAELATDLLATCRFVRVDTDRGVVEGASAGHPPPFVRRADGSVGAFEVPVGVPLGVGTGAAYRSVEFPLERGTLLLLYTDGLTTARGADLMPRVGELLTADHPDPGHHLEGLADRLVAALPAPLDRRDEVVLLLARYEASASRHRSRFARMEIERHDLLGVRAARRFVRESLRDWRHEDLADQLELMASEVVTNAPVLADSRVDLRLREGPDHVRLEVRDSDVTPPVPSPISGTDEENARAEHGRGLLVVDSLAAAWGTSPSGRGKTVRLELPTGGAPAPS